VTGVALNLPALAAVIVVVLVAGFIILVWLARDPRSRHTRVGVFMERDIDRDDDS